MDLLTQEQDKINHMETIKSSKYRALATRVLIPSKGKNKAKDLRQQDKKKKERTKSSDGGLNPCKDKDKKKKENSKCT